MFLGDAPGQQVLFERFVVTEQGDSNGFRCNVRSAGKGHAQYTLPDTTIGTLCSIKSLERTRAPKRISAHKLLEIEVECQSHLLAKLREQDILAA